MVVGTSVTQKLKQESDKLLAEEKKMKSYHQAECFG